MKTTRYRYHLLAIACTAAFGHSVQAQSLSALYESARTYDAAYLSAKAQHDANLAKSEQARAGVLPTANLSAGVSRTNLEVTSPRTERTFTTQSVGVTANQPLYRPANWATYDQGKKQIELSKSALDAVEQDIIVRVSQAYFDVLASQDSLTFVKAQKTAVAEQLASAKRNFEVGTSTITDTREAQARYDLVIAQEIAAENDLRVKKLALDIVVGKTGTDPRPVALPLNLPALTPNDVNQWVLQSEDQHPSIKSAQVALDVAKLETTKAEAGNKPTLDGTLGYNISRNPNGGTTSGLSSQTNSASIGVVFNYPLFAGYAIQNRIKETVSLEEKARNDLEGAKRAIAQATRTAYFGVVSGQGQVKALEAAEASSQSALDANKLGYQVGVRINIDVLNSQSQLFQIKRDLAKARYDVLVGGLRLRQANGTLKPEDLDAVNTLLAK